MANVEIVLGLTGREIRNDILDQIDKALSKDCNLRDTDSYGLGYEGTVEIKLKCRAMDVTDVSVSAELRPTPELQKLGTEREQPGEEVPTKEIEINEHVEIPLETNLNAVRERSDQGIPMQSVGEGGEPTIRHRTFRDVQGGALEAPESL